MNINGYWFLLSIMEFFGLLVLSFSIFRLPFKPNVYKHLFNSVFLAAISIYQMTDKDLIDYHFGTQILALLLLYVFTYGLPVRYTFLLCLSGYSVAFLIQVGLVFAFDASGIIPIEKFAQTEYKMIAQALDSLLYTGLAILLARRRIGFLFSTKIKNSKSSSRFMPYIYSALIFCLVGMQIIIFQLDKFSNRYIHFSIITIGFLIFLGFLIYLKNKEELKEKTARIRGYYFR